MTIKNYQDLDVWKKSMDLAVILYSLSREFPAEERFGLPHQIQKSAVSIPSNIAEGWGRNSTKDYIRFLGIARGSLYELETQILIANRIGYLNEKTVEKILSESNTISKMLMSLIRSLERK